jgi:epoxyqueuosine reductase QueG
MLPEAVIPTLDERFEMLIDTDAPPFRVYSVNWSERHAAYAAGLGTFSMPGGIITKRGTAGRLGSIVTTMEITPTSRPYEDIYEYCIQCSKCVSRCPAGAVSEDMKKDSVRCSAQLNIPKEKLAHYYGCGKCQTAVPCESVAPGGV